MNDKAQAVARIEPLAQWRPERRLAPDPQLLRDLVRPGGGRADAIAADAAVRTAGAKVIDLALGKLLLAVASGTAQQGHGAEHDARSAGQDLQAALRFAAQRGLTLPARVEQRTDAGAYRLAVSGQSIMLALAEDLHAGDSVLLRPRIGEPSNLSAAAAAPPPLTAAASELGSAAQLISRLLAAASAAQPIGSRGPLSAAPGDPAQLAAGLRDMLRSSGLFYESHLADWVSGAGNKADLLREPQAALGADAAAAQTQEARTAGEPQRLAPLAETLVQRQLGVMERRETLWQVQLWPGQEAELRIAPEDGAQRPQGPEHAWQAAIRVNFPGLGPVEAKIALRGRSASFDLRAADTPGVGALQAARASLAEALGAHGLAATRIQVSHADAE